MIQVEVTVHSFLIRLSTLYILIHIYIVGICFHSNLRERINIPELLVSSSRSLERDGLLFLVFTSLLGFLLVHKFTVVRFEL